MGYLVALSALIVTMACAAHKQIALSRPTPTDAERLVDRNVLFHTGAVNLKQSTVVIEPLLPPAYLATWFEGDLKRQPVERMLINCDVYEVIHDGGRYTKLSCPELGDVFIKSIMFLPK